MSYGWSVRHTIMVEIPFIRFLGKNRYMRTGGLLVALAIFLFVAPVSHAQTIAEWDHDFNSYPTGSVDGYDGWSGDVTVEVAASGYLGNALYVPNGTGQDDVSKSGLFNLLAGGVTTLVFYGQVDGNTGQARITLKENDGGSICAFGINDNSGSKFYVSGAGVSYKDLVVTNTWYRMEVNIDDVANTCQMNIPSLSTTTAAVSFVDTAATNTTAMQLVLDDGNGDDAWIDHVYAHTNGFTSDDDDDDPIPPITENYIVLTAPIKNTPYATTLSGQLNIVTPTSSTTAYRITFESTTGIDYTSLTISTTTTDSSEYSFSHTVNFVQDDIVFVRAYVYDDPTENAVNLADLSPQYEWWVSANANPSEPVDLGMFRTGTSTFCGSSGGPLDFAWGTCQAFRLLFVPNESSLDYIGDLTATATATAPFSYVYDVNTYLDELFTPTSTVWSIATPSTTPALGEITLLTSATIDSSTNYQTIRTFMGYAIYLSMIMYVYMRIRRVAANL